MSNSDLLFNPRILGELRIPIVLTAQLPPADAAHDGLLLIEDGGTGNGNLVIYVKGKRYRLDGGTAF